LGRSYLGLACTAPLISRGEHSEKLTLAGKHLDQAVDRLRQSGNVDRLPCGLIARAAWHRFCYNSTGAQADLSEALEIAERDSMLLHQCDACLEWARFHLQSGNFKEGLQYVIRARELILETGYKRREQAVSYLEQLLSRQP
jgi:hypothetical protein